MRQIVKYLTIIFKLHVSSYVINEIYICNDYELYQNDNSDTKE